MKDKLKSKLFYLLGLLLLGALAPLLVFAQISNPASDHATPTTSTEIVQADKGLVNCGTNNDINKPEGNPDDATHACTLYDLFSIFARMINFLMALAGFFAIFQIVRAGQSMVLAMGNPESLTAAKGALTNAVLGFALVLIAYILMYFVIYQLLGIKDFTLNLFFHPIEYLSNVK
jgi:hypothetical protein